MCIGDVCVCMNPVNYEWTWKFEQREKSKDLFFHCNDHKKQMILGNVRPNLHPDYYRSFASGTMAFLPER